MFNPLLDELKELDYIPVETLDLEFPPEKVIIYLRNNSEQDTRVLIEFLDPEIQQQFENQNPSLKIEDTGQATVCLAAEDDRLIPFQVIEDVSLTTDDMYRVTVDDVEFEGDFQEVLQYLRDNDYQVIVSQDCPAVITDPLVLQNNYFDYSDEQTVCLAYKVEKLDGGNSPEEYRTVEVPVSSLKGSETFRIPNAGDYDTPNYITSQYIDGHKFLIHVSQQLLLESSVTYTEFPPCKSSVITQTCFLGLETYPVFPLHVQNKVEFILNVNDIPHSFGVFEFTAETILDGLHKVYDHYIPKLQAYGFDVIKETRNGGIFKPPVMLKMSIDSSDTLIWDIAHRNGFIDLEFSEIDWYSTKGYMWYTDCPDGINTQADFNTNFQLTIKPVTADFVPDIPGSEIPFEVIFDPQRITFLPYDLTPLTLPPNGEDWMVRNYPEQQFSIESCYSIVPQPM